MSWLLQRNGSSCARLCFRELARLRFYQVALWFLCNIIAANGNVSPEGRLFCVCVRVCVFHLHLAKARSGVFKVAALFLCNLWKSHAVWRSLTANARRHRSGVHSEAKNQAHRRFRELREEVRLMASLRWGMTPDFLSYSCLFIVKKLFVCADLAQSLQAH